MTEHNPRHRSRSGPPTTQPPTSPRPARPGGASAAHRSTVELHAAAIAGDHGAELVLRGRALDDPAAAEAYLEVLQVVVADELRTGSGPAAAAVTAVCDQISAALRDLTAPNTPPGTRRRTH